MAHEIYSTNLRTKNKTENKIENKTKKKKNEDLTLFVPVPTPTNSVVDPPWFLCCIFYLVIPNLGSYNKNIKILNALYFLMNELGNDVDNFIVIKTIFISSLIRNDFGVQKGEKIILSVLKFPFES